MSGMMYSTDERTRLKAVESPIVLTVATDDEAAGEVAKRLGHRVVALGAISLAACALNSLEDAEKAREKMLRQLCNLDLRGCFTSAKERHRFQYGGRVEQIVSQDWPGRNEICPCGSGKKFKKCCGGAK